MPLCWQHGMWPIEFARHVADLRFEATRAGIAALLPPCICCWKGSLFCASYCRRMRATALRCKCASWAPPRSCVQVQPDLSEPLLLQVCDGASIIHPRICCREGSLLCGPLLLHACNSALLQAYAA